MKRTFLAVALLCLIGGAVLSGCSDSSKDTTTPPAATDTNTPAPPK